MDWFGEEWTQETIYRRRHCDWTKRMKFEANVEDESVCSQRAIVVFGIWKKLEGHVHSSDQYLVGELVGA